MPRFITHTNFIFLPIKVVVNIFSYMRPIYLSNFDNKTFSRTTHDRIKELLPQTISKEQNDFVYGKNIAKNILVVQKIITTIKKRDKTCLTWSLN